MRTVSETSLRAFWGDLPPYVREGIMFFLDGGIVPPTVIGDMLEENGGDREWTGALLSWHHAQGFVSRCTSLAYRASYATSVYLDASIQGDNHPHTVRIGFRTVSQRMLFEEQLRKGMSPSWLRNWADDNMGYFTFS